VAVDIDLWIGCTGVSGGGIEIISPAHLAPCGYFPTWDLPHVLCPASQSPMGLTNEAFVECSFGVL
jgi:hypothetical protein